MNIVANQVFVIKKFASLEARFSNRFFTNLFAKNLKSNIVLSQKYKFHLIKDKFYLLFVFHRAVGFDLNLLNLLTSFVNFTVCFVHLNKLLGASCIFTFKEHFTF